LLPAYEQKTEQLQNGSALVKQGTDLGGVLVFVILWVPYVDFKFKHLLEEYDITFV